LYRVPKNGTNLIAIRRDGAVTDRRRAAIITGDGASCPVVNGVSDDRAVVDRHRTANVGDTGSSTKRYAVSADSAVVDRQPTMVADPRTVREVLDVALDMVVYDHRVVEYQRANVIDTSTTTGRSTALEGQF